MKPPPRPKTDYERIPSDEWITGIIEDIQYDMEHKTSHKGVDKIGPSIRFKFKLDGLQRSHSSRWMSFTYFAKGNLYDKYLKNLIENAEPDMDFDLDKLKGLKIKTMWTANGEFDNLEQIRAMVKFPWKSAGTAVKEAATEAQAPIDEPPEEVGEGPDEIPF